MKIVYASDVHGRTSQYEELLELAAGESAGGIVLGGDLLPPPRGLSSPAARTDAASRQRAYLAGELMPRLDHAKRGGREVLLLLGNYDLGAISAEFEELCAAHGFHSLHQSIREAGGVVFAGLSWVNWSPFALKDWETWDRAAGEAIAGAFDHADPRAIFTWDRPGFAPIAETLAELAATPGARRAPEVYVLHAPPHGTGLDMVARNAPGVGSLAIREFIEKRAPRLTLHGHIHESPHLSGSWAVRMGDTLAIQPGQSPDQLHAVVVDTDDPGGTARHTIFGALG
jgi:Icc-related predicted phosphoesterase